MISYDQCAISYENCAIFVRKKKKTSRVGGIFRVGRVTPIQHFLFWPYGQIIGGIPKMFVLCKISQNIDGFTQFTRILELIKLYFFNKQNPLEIFLFSQFTETIHVLALKG